MFCPEIIRGDQFCHWYAQIVETQKEIVVATAESNLCRQMQSTSAVFCLPPFEDAFGLCTINEANCNDVIASFFILPEGSDPFAVPLI